MGGKAGGGSSGFGILDAGLGDCEVERDLGVFGRRMKKGMAGRGGKASKRVRTIYARCPRHSANIAERHPR